MRFRSRPSHATVVAYVSLFVALGGTAVAIDGSLPGQNTVGTDDLINGEVKAADIAKGAVATDEIAQGQVKAADIGDGEVKAADIAGGAVTNAEIAAGGVRSDEVQDNTLTGADIASGAVSTEEIANRQVQAEDLAAGVAPGASGARAWGLVNQAGDLLRSKNVADVSHPDGANYCIDPGSGIDPTTAVMVVGEASSVNSTEDGVDDASHVEWRADGAGCPAGRMAVFTYVANGEPASLGATDTGGFDLDPLAQGFTFVIP